MIWRALTPGSCPSAKRIADSMQQSAWLQHIVHSCCGDCPCSSAHAAKLASNDFSYPFSSPCTAILTQLIWHSLDCEVKQWPHAGRFRSIAGRRIVLARPLPCSCTIACFQAYLEPYLDVCGVSAKVSSSTTCCTFMSSSTSIWDSGFIAC